MCGLFLTGPESRSVFEEARSLEVLTPAPDLKNGVCNIKRNNQRTVKF